jgi:hypothetical protein
VAACSAGLRAEFRHRDFGFRNARVVLSFLRFATDLTPYRTCANRSFDHLVGAPGITAATPSGLMLKAKNVKGVSLGFPH